MSTEPAPSARTASATQPPAGDAPQPGTAARGSGLAELVVPALLFAMAVFLIIGTATMVEPPSVQRPGPTFFPLIVIGLLLLMAVLCTVQTLRTARSSATAPAAADDVAVDADGDPVEEIPPNPPPGRAPWPATTETDWRAVLTVLGSLVAFTILLVPVGWILAAAVLFWGVAYGLGSRRPVFDISVALVVSSAVQLAFGYALGLNLPAGFLAGVL